MSETQNNYLNQTLPPNEEWVLEIEDQAIKDNVPIMDRVGINFVMQLVRISKPTCILEVGTAIGYSALRMLQANPKTSIVTIERDEKRYQQALDNIKHQKKESNIDVIFGDALEELQHLEKGKFNLIFIDAAKGQYKHFFDLCLPLLSENGIIVTDNVLFRGFVANPESAPKRYRKMVDKLRDYNEYLMKHEDFHTTIIPIGDGVAVSYKKAKGRYHT
ncbi:O-methyltransferase [Oceanobacillus senegalensis]|uniref:O-methyltransferase n=1 Tax=Oceanobacillus senegalensis TaxID=1936063 RepID=UPI000A306DA6|nr:O-methyltransferase [Oceanobacillus senegalensis]